MSVQVIVSTEGGQWSADVETWSFPTAAEAIRCARDEASGFESSGFWWNDRGFFMRYGNGDYPETRTIVVCQGDNVISWRDEF